MPYFGAVSLPEVFLWIWIYLVVVYVEDVEGR
jgi:hypothetical protein